MAILAIANATGCGGELSSLRGDFKQRLLIWRLPLLAQVPAPYPCHQSVRDCAPAMRRCSPVAWSRRATGARQHAPANGL